MPGTHNPRPRGTRSSQPLPSSRPSRSLRASPLALLAACAALVAGTPAVQAQDKPVQLKLSSWVPAQHRSTPRCRPGPTTSRRSRTARSLPSLFPSEQLGKAFDHYDMARDGIADFTYVNPGYQPGRFPVISAANRCPSWSPTPRPGSAAIDAWYRKYAAKEMKDVKFCFAFVHDRHLALAKKITVPTELKGMKIRPATSTNGRSSPRWAAPTCRCRRPRRATCWSAAWPTPSPSPGAPSACSASTRP
jgi:TRAP-type C4-dicarboxylate transport system substrate-binding protein